MFYTRHETEAGEYLTTLKVKNKEIKEEKQEQTRMEQEMNNMIR